MCKRFISVCTCFITVYLFQALKKKNRSLFLYMMLHFPIHQDALLPGFKGYNTPNNSFHPPYKSLCITTHRPLNFVQTPLLYHTMPVACRTRVFAHHTKSFARCTKSFTGTYNGFCEPYNRRCRFIKSHLSLKKNIDFRKNR